jgi:hypothetical protein
LGHALHKTGKGRDFAMQFDFSEIENEMVDLIAT